MHTPISHGHKNHIKMPDVSRNEVKTFRASKHCHTTPPLGKLSVVDFVRSLCSEQWLRRGRPRSASEAACS